MQDEPQHTALPAQLAASSSRSLTDLQTSALGLTWCTTFPEQQGRQSLILATIEGEQREPLPPAVWVGTRIHEYGGRAHCIAGTAIIYSNLINAGVYRCATDAGSAPEVIIPGGKRWFGDFAYDPTRDCIFAIMEDRTQKPFTNSIVLIDCATASFRTIWQGSDFVICPRISPDGSTIAWIAWNQPSMPWDGGELWSGALDEHGNISNAQHLLGATSASVNAFTWTRANTLIASWEASGFWNLYALDGSAPPKPLTSSDRECGYPQWNFGLQPFLELSTGQIAFSWTKNGETGWSILDPHTLNVTDLPLSFTSGGRMIVEWNNMLVSDVASGSCPPGIASWDFAGNHMQIIASSFPASHLVSFPSPEPVSVAFPTRDGGTAYAIHFPVAADIAPTTPPPLIIKVHGGPTSQSRMEADLNSRFWTTHGFQLLYVNYRGSSGYGAHYRHALDGSWGELDVNDCCDAALWATAQGLTAKDRIFISGGSSGGLTVLSALAHGGPFAGGTSYYGVGDISLLREDCHKFEEEYLDTLVAPPSNRQLYKERSPINFVANVHVPILLFHGLDDTVVPPSQTRTMVEQLERQHKTVAYRMFPNEGHRFGKAQDIAYTLEAERFFYLTIMGFDPPHVDPPLEILHFHPSS